MGPQRKIRNRRPRQLQCSTKYPLSKEPQNLKNAGHHPSVKQTPNLGKAELKVVSLIQSDVNGSDDDQSNGLAILFCNSGVPILSSLLFKSSSTSTTDWVLVGGSTKYIDPIKSNGREDDRSNGLAILFCNNGVPISSLSGVGYWWVVALAQMY